MCARGLDVGHVSSTISGRHLANIDSMSGRCLKTIEARSRLGRLSQGGAVVDEDIYVISGQRRSLLSRRACETLNLVKLVAVDSVETADYYKDNNPKLFGGLGRMSGGDYSIQLREDAVPFALPTPRRVSIPLMDVVKRELQRMEDLQVIRRVDTPTDWCAGMAVVAKPRVVASTVEGEEKETHKGANMCGPYEAQ